MATARSALRGLLIDEIQGDRYTGLVCDAGCNTTSLIDTGLGALPGGNDDDFCLGWYTIMEDGGEAGETGRVTGYSASAFDITITPAMTGSPSAGEKFTLSRYDPNDLNNAINRAVELLFPDVTVPKRDETLFIDDLLSNSDGETFSVTFTSWTHTAGTWTQETTRVIHGSNSFKGVASGSDAQLEQNLFTGVNIHDIAGRSLRFEGFIWASDASAARLRVSFDGSTYSNSPYHAGSSEWEGPGLQYVSVFVPTDATEMTFWLEVADGFTAYFDRLAVYVDPIYKYTIPSAILKGPYTLSIQHDRSQPNGAYFPVTEWRLEEDSSGRYIMLDYPLSPGCGLRVDGHGQLATMSSDSATTEVDAPRTNLVVARAAQWLFEYLAQDSSTQDSEKYLQMAQRWGLRTQQLLRTSGFRSRKRAARSDLRWQYG